MQIREKIKTHILKVKIEPDEDRWPAYCPALEEKGAATWGYTRGRSFKEYQGTGSNDR